MMGRALPAAHTSKWKSCKCSTETQRLSDRVKERGPTHAVLKEFTSNIKTQVGKSTKLGKDTQLH